MRKALQLSPVFAAIPFALHQSFQLLFRPDTIYIPILFEVLFFGVGYVIFGILNALVFVPIARIASERTTSIRVGLWIALVVAGLGVLILVATDIVEKRRLLDGSALFAAFIPMAISMYTSFKYIADSKSPAGAA